MLMKHSDLLYFVFKRARKTDVDIYPHPVNDAARGTGEG
jgi:hypothetical protein